MLFSGFSRKMIIFALVNTYTMRKTVLYIILLMLVLSACTADHEAMRQRLQYVSDCNRADTVFSEAWLPTVDSLVIYFDRHGSANDRMMAHYVQGRVYHDMGEAPQALECYQHAAEVADTTSNDCDLYTLYAVYGQMANLFHAQFLPGDEMQVLQMAEHIAWKSKDTLAAMTMLDLRSRPYYLKNEKDSVLLIESQSRNLYLKFGYRQKAARSLIYTISIFLDRHLYHEADSCMHIFEQESGLFNGKGDIEKGREIYYYDKGRFLLGVNNYNLALRYFRKLVGTGNDEAAYRGLLLAYEKIGETDSIAKYAKLFAYANDNSFAAVEQSLIHHTAAVYNYSRQQRIAEERSSKLKLLKLSLIIVITLSLIVILCVTIFLLKKRLKAESRAGFMGHKYAAQLFELAKNKSEKVFIEQHYKEVIADKELCEALLKEKIRKYEVTNDRLNKDYGTSLQEMENLQAEMARIREDFSSIIEEKSKLIDNLQKRLNDQADNIDQDMVKENLLSFFESDEYKVFERCRHFTKNYVRPTMEEWSNLIKLFKKHFTRYYLFLVQHKLLTENQFRMCVLLRLNFSESEILLVMGLAHKQSVTKIKSQVNEKLFHRSGARSLKENLETHF
jgi:tetratricopeptide (TPR) repeat protein